MNNVVRVMAIKTALLVSLFVLPASATHAIAQELAVVTNRTVAASSLEDGRADKLASGSISLRKGAAKFNADAKVLAQPEKYGDFVFIHGYNRGPYKASKLALALGAHIGKRAILFSWPSFGRVDRYMQDRANAEWSSSDFANWLKATSHLRDMPIIAHSMGSVVLLEAIRELAAHETPKRIVLMASDIDADRFVRLYQPMLVRREVCTLIVLADNDRALQTSEQVNGGIRLGAWVDMPSVEGLDVMDVSSVNESFVGHEYFKENNEITRSLRTWLSQPC